MKKDTYIFVRNAYDIKTLKSLMKGNKIDLSSSSIVLWNNSMAQYFQNKGKYVLLEEYFKKINLRLTWKNSMEFIKAFPHIKILNDKSLIELLEYNGYSLWWFVRQGFHGHCLKVMNEILTVKSLIKGKKINKITILNRDEEFVAIVKEAARNSKIRVDILTGDIAPKEKNFLNYLKKRIGYVFDYLPRLIRIVQGLFRSLQIENKPGKNIILLTQSHAWTSLTGNIKGDANSYTILRDMSKAKKYNVLPLDMAFNKDAAWKGIKEKKKPFLPFDYFIFKSFLDSGIRKNLNSLRLRLKKLSKLLDKSLAFKRAFVCDNINLYHILRLQINNYFLNEFGSFIGAARNFEIGKKLLKDYDINAAICLDESGTSRFLVFAANACKLPSLGLQHGIIPTLPGPSCNYSKKDLYHHKTNLNCLLPDKIAVFGNYFKSLLIKHGNYDPNEVVVTGQPRMDIFFEQKEKYSKRNLYKKLRFGSRDKLIVYASQPFGEESRIAFTALVKALKHLGNARLIVKLHPSENASPYKTLLQELGYDATISKYIDLYEILICSDLVVSIQSTVILEALALEKPVIQLNLIERYKVFGELANKCIKIVDKETELNKEIKRILYSQYLSKELGKTRKKYISEYYYKIDGNSTKRFIELVESLLITNKENKG